MEQIVAQSIHKKPKLLGPTCRCAHMSTRILTRTGPGPKLYLRCERKVDYPPQPCHGHKWYFCKSSRDLKISWWWLWRCLACIWDETWYSLV